MGLYNLAFPWKILKGIILIMIDTIAILNMDDVWGWLNTSKKKPDTENVIIIPSNKEIE